MTLQLLIALAPLALFVIALVNGRYPGERRIERVRRRYSGAGRLAESEPALRAPQARRSIRATGREVLALWLAGRAPPAMS